MKRARPKSKKKALKREKSNKPDRARIYVIVLVILICVSLSVICLKLLWDSNKAEPAEDNTDQLTASDAVDADIAENTPENEETGLDNEHFSYIYSID